jgi:glycosyltransferase involved in cell wall biosynthesis
VKLRYLEIVSGLGMGGAEKSFLNRIRWAPQKIQTLILNTRPELAMWAIPPEIPSVDCKRNGIAFPIRLRNEIERFDPHVVTVRSPIDFIFVASIKWISRAKWHLVYEAHSTRLSQNTFIGFLLAPLMRLSFSQTSFSIAVSKSVAKGSQCRGARDLTVHYFGADANPSVSESRNLNFIFVGRIVPLKQPLLLLSAVSSLSELFRRREASLQIVGAGPLESEVKNFIEKHELHSFVEFVGYSDNLDSIYSRSEYLVSSSKFEGLPISFFEAKLHGLKILTFPSSGDFDILGPEDIVLKNSTEHELKSALEVALMNGVCSASDRRQIQEQNQWMLAKRCAVKYYQLVEDKLTLTKLS